VVSPCSCSIFNCKLTADRYIGHPHCPLLLDRVFCCPAWDAFSKLVVNTLEDDDDTTVATTTASDELLRVQPEIALMISKLVNAVKSHGDIHQEKLEKVLSVVKAMANGQFQIALPGPLTAQLVAPSLPTQQLPLVPVPAPVAPLPQTDSTSHSQRAPEYTLFDARTVADVWREWRDGIAGRPPPEAKAEG
jgi:hypothetical protein